LENAQSKNRAHAFGPVAAMVMSRDLIFSSEF
jgi:hypothetical protein